MNGTHPLKRIIISLSADFYYNHQSKTCDHKRCLCSFSLCNSLDSIAAKLLLLYNIASTRFLITATVANPPSSLSWPPLQPSSSSTPFVAASIPPDHSSSSSAVGINTPDYMLGLRNIFLLSPPPQITRPSPSPVNFAAVEENKSVGEKVCRDCGNRAKKECLFERCRTCCKSRGYKCATHVKSTWVPSSVTRSSSSSSERTKKLKIDKQTSANVSLVPTTTPRQERSFKEGLPGKIEAPAVFRRTRVTAISNNEQAEIGYQATVTISGHVFKGFLHYYGVDHNKAFPCLSQK